VQDGVCACVYVCCERTFESYEETSSQLKELYPGTQRGSTRSLRRFVKANNLRESANHNEVIRESTEEVSIPVEIGTEQGLEVDVRIKLGVHMYIRIAYFNFINNKSMKVLVPAILYCTVPNLYPKSEMRSCSGRMQLVVSFL
jgi:hypothetical protein